MQSPKSLALSLATVCFLASIGYAQTDTATISGIVHDASGGAVNGAMVDAESLGTGAKRFATSSSDGVYALPALPLGHYKVTVNAPGFQTYVWEDVQLQVGQNRTLDAQMQVASVGASVTVSETVSDLAQTSAEISGVVSGQQVRELPLNGRNWASLMAQTPGAIDSGGASGSQRSIRFVGRGLDDNNYRFDGVDATGILNQAQKGTFRLQFSTEAISEFRARAALYTAENGGTQGGQVDLVSSSGTNDFHGSAFEYLRNDFFDARGPFDPAQLPPFRLNQFGGSFGGPIRKDKDFFFVSYEGLRQRVGQTLIGFVPSAAFRTQVLTTTPGLGQVIAAYPLGTRSTSNANVDRYVGSGRQITNEDFGMFRYDHHFSDAVTLFVRYNTDQGLSDLPNGVLRDRTATTLDTHNAVIGLTAVLSPRSINEFRFGFNRANYVVQNESVLNSQIILSSNDFSTLYNNTGKIQASNSFDTLDQFSTVRGNHTIRAGFEIRRVQINATATSSNDYEFTFTNAASFLNGTLAQASLVNTLPITGLRRTEYFGYVQDEFRVTPNLTANLGVRYEYFGVPYEVNGRGIVFDPINCPGGYCPAGTPFYQKDYNNFSPRVSLAWAPSVLKNRTVIRTGYGSYYGDGQVGDLTAPVDNLAERILLNSSGLRYPISSTYANDQFAPVAPRSLDQHRRTPYLQDWGLSVQHAVTTNTVLTVGYLGTKGTDQFTRNYLNTFIPGTTVRPYPSFGVIDYKSTHSNSTFNAFQFELQRNLSSSLMATLNYMWSHSINDGATGGGEADYPQNVNCRACEKASSDQDVRNFFSGNLIYQLPFGRNRRFLNSGGVATAILGGWEWSNILYARSGLPVNITIGRAASVIPDGNTLSPQRPNVVPNVNIVPTNQTINSFLNINTFTTPAPGTFGNAGRNLGRGPDNWQLDLALNKRIPLTERLNLIFRGEAFNIFNHPQYGLPLSNFSSRNNFGQINTELNASGVGTGTPRELQLALRLEF
jgi:hypothetical protein